METDSQTLTARMLAALPQAILLAESTGEIACLNPAAEALLPRGRDISAVLRFEGAAVLNFSADWAALAEESELHRPNVQISGPGDRRLTVDIVLRRLWDAGAADCDRRHVLLWVEDAAGRVSMERRLAAAERVAATGQLAARVAHELNNPLDGVLRYVGLAERVGGDDAQTRKYLQGARDGLLRMAEIIRSLRQEGAAGAAGGERRPVAQLLTEAVRAMQPRADALGVAVITDVTDDDEPRAAANVFQVFCNIIKNALDAMPTGGLLQVRMRRRDGQCVVRFADNGCGLRCGDPERAFELFYTTKPSGSGLGLAISRDILTQLGGRIAAEPRTEGGTALTVLLPAGGNPTE